MERLNVAIETLGCRLNISESGTFADQFKELGHEVGKIRENMDLVLINTCSVTEKAEATCRNIIRKAKKVSPKARIVVVGCYAQTAADEIKEKLEVDLVLGSFEKNNLFEYLKELDGNKHIHVEKNDSFFTSRSTKAEGHTRAFLKIQDGCNYVCSYCIIPRARGKSRSLNMEEVLREANLILDEGFKEIIITGVNIGDYHDGDKGLKELLSEILKLDRLERLRLSSIEPNILDEDFIKMLCESKKVMNHFHVPLQNGDDEILKSMRRKYSVSEYKTVIQNIKKYFPEAGIGADVIVGFPGETDQQYQNTKNLIEEMPITHLHVFPFSARKKTIAYNMDGKVHDQTKKDRAKELILIGEKKLEDFLKEQVGKSFKVLFEQRNKEGHFTGFTPHYLKVKVRTNYELNNLIKDVKIVDSMGDTLIGELL